MNKILYIVLFCVLIYVFSLNIRSMDFKKPTKIISDDNDILKEGTIEYDQKNNKNREISKHIETLSNSADISSSAISQKIANQFLKFKIKPTLKGTIQNLLDDSSVLLNKFLGSASVANVSVKTPELENFDDYAPQSLICPGPIVKFFDKTPKNQSNVVPHDVEAIPQRSSLYGSDMTTIFDERAPETNISSHMGFGDVSDRNDKIPDW